MLEAIVAGALIAVAIRLIARSAEDPDGFVLRTSRGAYMRELNRKQQAPDSRQGECEPAQHV